MSENKLSFSNTLILLSIFFTLLTFVFDGIYLFGMNGVFFNGAQYHMWFLQFFTSQFLHGSILHLLFNSIFIFYFWNILEEIIGYKKMIVFFIWNAVFLGLFITFLWGWNTVWISGFALAILTYYTLLLKSRNNPEYTGGITAIVINVAVGLSPWISFLGHFWGMIFWGIFFFFSQKRSR